MPYVICCGQKRPPRFKNPEPSSEAAIQELASRRELNPCCRVKAGGPTGTVRDYRNADALDCVPRMVRNDLMCPRYVSPVAGSEQPKSSGSMYRGGAHGYGVDDRTRAISRSSSLSVIRAGSRIGRYKSVARCFVTLVNGEWHQ